LTYEIIIYVFKEKIMNVIIWDISIL